MRDLAVHESGEPIDLAAPTPEHQELLRGILKREGRPRTRAGEIRCAAHEAPLYLQVRRGIVYACHWAGTGFGPHRVSLMSNEHRRQVEYVALAADRAGLDVDTEVSLATHVRPDLVIAKTTAVEVQRSALTAGRAKARTAKAVRGGMSISLWISDREPKRAPSWMYQVPSATVFARSWQAVPPLGSATVTGGARTLVPVKCKPPGRTSCLLRKGRAWCGEWHVIHQPMLGVSLDLLTVGVANGEYVPAVLGSHVLLARESQVSHYGLEWKAPSLGAPATSKASPQRLQCRNTPSADTEQVCCGERPLGQHGGPLLPPCQLCPKSSSYWRKVRSLWTASPL